MLPRLRFLIFIYFYLREGFLLSLRLEHSGKTTVHRSLDLSGSINSPASASQVAEMTGTRHHIQLIFVFLVERGFHHLGQDGLELVALSDPPASTSQVTEITDMSHCTQSQIICI